MASTICLPRPLTGSDVPMATEAAASSPPAYSHSFTPSMARAVFPSALGGDDRQFLEHGVCSAHQYCLALVTPLEAPSWSQLRPPVCSKKMQGRHTWKM